MGSYEIILKTEEMIKKMQEDDYVSAQKVLDTINLKKVKNITDLSLMAEVFSKNERNDEALELLLRVYNKIKTRKILYQLILVSIKRENAEDAERYLKEYEELAPNDFYKYIFRYKIDALKGEPYDVLIASLKTLKKTEYIEQWAYELAKLYFKAGLEEECLEECSDIILWFGDGNYVEKAKMLKAYCSGEADKDKIIKELKNMSENKNADDGTEEQEDTEYKENDEAITENTATQDTDTGEDGTKQDAYELTDHDEAEKDQIVGEPDSFKDNYKVDISENEEADTLTDSIKKEVENILSEELQESNVYESDMKSYVKTPAQGRTASEDEEKLPDYKHE